MHYRKTSQNKLGDKSTTHMSNTDISKCSRVSKDILQTHHSSFLYFNSLYLKLLVYQSKLSGIRRDTLKCKLSEMNLDFEIWRADCRRQKYSFSVYSVDNPLTNTFRSSYKRFPLANITYTSQFRIPKFVVQISEFAIWNSEFSIRNCEVV